MMDEKINAVIVASGTGSRLESNFPKQFIRMYGKTILEWTIYSFEQFYQIDSLFVVIHPNYLERADAILDKFKKVKCVVPGGETRQISVMNGLKALPDTNGYTFIHDSVRPFVTEQLIDRCITAFQTHDAVVAGIPVIDTIYKINQEGEVETVPDRKNYYFAQTPQGFKTAGILEAHLKAAADKNFNFSDDVGLFLQYCRKPIKIIPGDPANIKITYPSDLKAARLIAKNFFKNN